MNYIRKSLTNVLVAITGVTVISAIAIWQLYLFATLIVSFGAVDIRGGMTHLLLAIGFGIFACIGGFLVFQYFFALDRR
jgi:hypothetical protein